MTDMKEFLLENKEKIHNLLNYLWRTIEHFAFRLEEHFSDMKLDNSHGNYISLQDGWAEAFYANPTITFTFGEIGYSLDGLYCAIAVKAKKVTEDLKEQDTCTLNRSQRIPTRFAVIRFSRDGPNSHRFPPGVTATS